MKEYLVFNPKGPNFEYFQKRIIYIDYLQSFFCLFPNFIEPSKEDFVSLNSYFGINYFIIIDNIFLLQDHNTPLHYAAGNGNTEIVSLLIEAGGDPNIANDVMSLVE